MERLEELKQKYDSVLEVIKQRWVRLDHLHVQDDKLFIGGAAPTQDIKNDVWNAIKAVNAGLDDIMADITVDSSLPAPPATQNYTVRPGDTLSKISKAFYGNASLYMKIAEANGIENPDRIQVGQELVIPPAE
ncbi:MAG: LysM peptidoglycan-binding domain-containing protein [Acidobacteria bacterium]|nr:LysM peptidoglycan-binding domain-containing protein [Acidobacteriota bacterium]